ncbi:MAG: hypothetical protein JSU73_09960 [candidate division WOR-3 bacterium]|nr:MAG: hypothetical protein JSU73_09960 [candidate division WOR-3 bacterium]
MIGLCGVAFAHDADQDLRTLDSMSRAFASGPSGAVRSVTWRLPTVACRLFYRESERLPEPDARLESAGGSRRAHAFVFGKVCPPRGYSFTSQDPLLRARACFESAYAEGGVDSLAGCNGNWAAVVCDNLNRTVVLARDPFGTQALYYERQGQTVCFATHLSALGHLNPNRQPDAAALAQFLHYLYVPSPRTAYAGVKSVPVGRAIEVSEVHDRSVSMHSRVPVPFWQERHVPESENSLTEAVGTFDRLLAEAVEARTAPTGRTAILLSGGKDSSSICVAASKIDPRRYLAVTVGFEDSSIDESEDAAVVARHLGIEHLVLKFSQSDYLDALDEFVLVHGQPLGDPAGLPTYLALKNLPSDIDTVLEGSGPEAYMGYTLSRFERLYLSLPLLRYFALQLPSAACSFLPRRLRRQVARFRKPPRELFVSWNGWSERELLKSLGIDANLAHTEMGRLGKSSSSLHPNTFNAQALDRIWASETTFPKLAQPAKYFNVTAGFPFCDSRLASFFSTLPEGLCFTRQSHKIVLREYMSRHLPGRILEKPKGSFNSRVDVLLRAIRTAKLREDVKTAAWSLTGESRSTWASAVVRRFLRGGPALSHRIYAMTLLSLWLTQRAKAGGREQLLHQSARSEGFSNAQHSPVSCCSKRGRIGHQAVPSR